MEELLLRKEVLWTALCGKAFLGPIMLKVSVFGSSENDISFSFTSFYPDLPKMHYFPFSAM